MLSIERLTCGYGEVEVLHDVSVEVRDEVFAVLGANGAGKSTLLKALARLLPATRGTIRLDGADVTRVPAHLMPARGLSYVPQEGNVFPKLSVLENLRIGGHVGSRPLEEKLEEVYGLFPRLKERTRQTAGSLSGGEGQMLAVARALLQEPTVLLLDEPSAGLSPQLVDTLFRSIAETRRQRGMTIVLAEQNAVKTLEIADRVMVLSLGAVRTVSSRADLDLQEVMKAYHI